MLTLVIIGGCCCWLPGPPELTLAAMLVIGLPMFGSGLAIDGITMPTGDGGIP